MMVNVIVLGVHGKCFPYLAVKVSAGKVRVGGDVAKYLSKCVESLDHKCSWLVEAVRKYPSVLEHVVITFWIDGVSRVVTHQLVRHRFASFTQQSLRYSVADEAVFVPDEVAVRGVKPFFKAVQSAFSAYKELVDAGVPVEDARYVLPMGVKSRLLMTVNLREFLHIVSVRLSRFAQPEMRELVEAMIDALRAEFPCIDALVEEVVGGACV